MNLEWIHVIFSGIGTALLTFFIPLVLKKIKNRGRLERSLEQDPYISREVKGLSSSSKLYCVTFKRNCAPCAPFDYKWKTSQKIEVETHDEMFRIPKETILDHLENKGDPYKFCLVVEKEEREKFWVNLLEARFTITGVGEPHYDSGEACWCIWFLVNNEPVHAEVRNPKFINHTLI